MYIKYLQKKFMVNPSCRENEYKERYMQIANNFTAESKSTGTPQLILIAGQPGAGKTSLEQVIKKNINSEDFIIIDIDAFRTYHPDINQIKKFGVLAPLLTNDFVFFVTDNLISQSISLKRNIIYNGALRDTDLVLNNLITPAIENGYEVSIHALSVSPLESYISAQLRYEEELLNQTSIARFVSSNYHCEACTGFEQSIQKFCSFGILRDIRIYERGSSKHDLPIIVYLEKYPKKNSNIIAFIHQHRKMKKLQNKSNILKDIHTLSIMRYKRKPNFEEEKALKYIEKMIITDNE